MPSTSIRPSTTKPACNDILMGRGSASNHFEGNVRFRALVMERKHEYASARNRKAKNAVAQSLLNHVHSTGGRFLKLVEPPPKGSTSIVQGGKWVEVSKEQALEKCKQSLREKIEKPAAPTNKERPADVEQPNNDKKEDNAKKEESVCNEEEEREQDHFYKRRESSVVSEETVCSSTAADTSNNVLAAFAMNPTKSVAPPLSPTSSSTIRTATLSEGTDLPVDQLMPADSSSDVADGTNEASLPNTSITSTDGSSAVAAASCETMASPSSNTLLVAPLMSPPSLFHSASALHPCTHVTSPMSSATSMLCLSPMAPVQTSLRQLPVAPVGMSFTQYNQQPLMQSGSLQQLESSFQEAQSMAGYTASSQETSAALPERGASNDDNDEEDVSEYLLSALSLSNRQIISEEDEAKERESMTDQERIAVLADLFGEICAAGTHHPNKRARRDLDNDSLVFLVGQMRLEISQIPDKNKKALLEAQSKSHPDEFNDERLIKFLRCEGMNAKLAALRFVRYWSSRREAFGDDKYYLRLRLGEALKDDLVAIECGVYCLLPAPDMSGRRILYWEPHRHTRQGYTSDSLRRAIWYTIEVAAQETTDIGSGIVQIHFERDTSLFDYDSKAHDCIANCLKSCWPVKMISSHICCPPRIPIRIMKPIIHAMLGKEMRSRVTIHDVPDKDIVQVLRGYGILRGMLPTQMGGTIALNMSEWIAHRRAFEMEMEEI